MLALEPALVGLSALSGSTFKVQGVAFWGVLVVLISAGRETARESEPIGRWRE
jgi:hypothetical protein